MIVTRWECAACETHYDDPEEAQLCCGPIEVEWCTVCTEVIVNGEKKKHKRCA